MRRETQEALAAELVAGHPVTGAYDADDVLAFAQLEERNVVQLQKVDYADVASYLMVVSKYLAISEAADASAKNFMLAMNTFKTFDLAKPYVLPTVEAQLDALITDTLIDSSDKVAILALANTYISRNRELSFSAKAYDVTNARAL